MDSSKKRMPEDREGQACFEVLRDGASLQHKQNKSNGPDLDSAEEQG